MRIRNEEKAAGAVRVGEGRWAGADHWRMAPADMVPVDVVPEEVVPEEVVPGHRSDGEVRKEGYHPP
ncbi:MAG TPA: hypothetical protein PLX83_15510 [bacterium]|nr:hypothetical protein [bacterium]